MGYKDNLARLFRGRWFTGDLLATNTITEDNITPGTITTASISETAGITSEQLAAGILTQGTRTPIGFAEITGLPLTASNLTPGTYPICTVPGGSLVIGCIAVARIAFDGDTAITVGRTAAQTSLMAAPTLAPINSVTGDDPAVLGTDLWVTGGQTTTAGNWTATFPTITTPDNWEVINKDTGTTLTEAELPFTQTTTTTVISAGSQTKTPSNFSVTTWAHPKWHWCASNTTYNAYLTSTTGTVGALDVYISYIRYVMAG
jgi:hypothetical protein